MTQLDHAKRSKGIGSSEIAMIVKDREGKPISPWGGPHKLWRIKTGREEFKLTTKDQRRGSYLEGALRQMYEDDNGYTVKVPRTKQHPEFDYVVDSADGLVFETAKSKRHKRTLELKTAVWPKPGDWGRPGTDQVPKYYLLQCLWHEGAHPSEDRICDVPALVSGVDKIYHVSFDEETYLALVYEAEKFWYDHVLADKEPEIDAHRDTDSWLQCKLFDSENAKLIEADNDMVEIMLRYRELKLLQSSYSEEINLLENKMKQAIGENEGLLIPGTKQKVTWKQDADSVGFQQKKFVDEYLESISQKKRKEIEEKYTGVTRKGARKFLSSALLKN